MGHVNPAACLPRKESWRWETTNSEYGKFYVRKTQREVIDGLEFQNDYSKKCEELTDELLEAKLQLEQLKISCARNICGPGLQDIACQTSPITPRPPSRKLYKNEKMNADEGHIDNQMLLGHVKEDHSRLGKRALLKPRNGRNNQVGLESGSHSPSSGSAKDGGPLSVGKRKILQKQEPGVSKKQKGSIVRAASSNFKHTAAGGANLPLSQRYTFYRYGGRGANTSKGWHSKTSPWMPI